MKRAPLLAVLAPLLLAPAARAEPSRVHAYLDGPAAAFEAARPERAAAAVVAHVDARRGVPTFLWGLAGADRPPAASTPEAAARHHLRAQAARYGVSEAALDAAAVERVHTLPNGARIVVLRQRFDGIEVFRRDVKVLLGSDDELVALSGAPLPSATATKGVGFAMAAVDAIAIAVSDLYGVSATALDFAPAPRKGEYVRYDATATLAARASVRFRDATRAKPVYYALPDRLVPAYFLEIDAEHATAEGRSSDAFAYVVAADDGRVLHRESLVHHDAFTYRVYARPDGDKRPNDGPLADFTPHPTGVPDGSYPPFAPSNLVTMEGFNHNPFQVADPWLAPGATETTGNNVDAYTDDDTPDGFSGGRDTRASVTSPGTFDRIYHVAKAPRVDDHQRRAAVTSLFYTTNWLHDWWYDVGFDEAAGNAQASNFGRGGVEGDPLHAEAQDGAPKTHDNSNMSAFADGKSPRMQMYVWAGTDVSALSIDGLGGDLATAGAAFGPRNYQLTAPVVVVDDGTGVVTDACEPVTNDLTGSIALVDRGTCDFDVKVAGAQAAGALGVLVVDNTSGEAPFPMSGVTAGVTVTIPSAMMTKKDGKALEAALAAGPVSATISQARGVERDGTIDNSVVAHEWGHYLHLRQVACNTNLCSGESEGWADFNSLMMVIHDGDDYDGVYPLVQYAAVADSQDPGYFGVRRYPYSIDMSVNPLTFKHIGAGVPLPANVPIASLLVGAPNTEPHDIGEVWASMLFEAYHALLARTVGPSPKYTYEDAHARMGRYVEGGLVLAPPEPTFLEQRDAILGVARAADMQDYLDLAGGFAKRGAGTCAVDPPVEANSNEPLTEGFDLRPNLQVVSMTLAEAPGSCDHDGYVDRGEKGVLTLQLSNSGPFPVVDGEGVASAPGNAITFPSGASFPIPRIEPFDSTVVKIDVAVNAALETKQAAVLSVAVTSKASCVTTQTIGVAANFNVDEAPGTSATDDVQTLSTRWKPRRLAVLAHGSPTAEEVWDRESGKGANHYWHGADSGVRTDTALESPTLDVDVTKAFVIHFTHRHGFEQSGGTNWDGGVVEVTSDDGATWVDVGTLGDVGYGGPIGDPMAHNPLLGRQGFIGQNASWPESDDVAIDLATKLAGKSVRVRFRIGTDDGQDAYGWDLDHIGFDGITNLPFATLVPDAQACHGVSEGGGGAAPLAERAGDVTPSGGCDCGLAAGRDSESDAALAWAAAAAAVARRRRRAPPRRGRLGSR